MEEISFGVKWKGKRKQMVLRAEEEEIRGYLPDDTHVLTIEFDDEDELSEGWCHDDLEYDGDELGPKLYAALEAAAEEEGEDESEEEESEDEESDDEESEDEEEDEGEEDEEGEESEESGDEADASDDDAEEDEGDEEVDEDDDADYGQPVRNARISGVPTLHAVLVAYGSGIDVDSDVRRLRRLFSILQDNRILNVAEQVLTGAEATAKNTLEAVNKIRAREDDVVWVYYSGHGCMEEGDRLLVTHGKMLRRAAIVDAVRKTPARLKVVLSDCCAVEVGRVSPRQKFGAARGGADVNKLKGLFMRYRGLFDASSSDDYQYSFAGVFTPALVDRVLLGATPATWGQVFERTQQLAMENSTGALPKDVAKMLQREGRTVEDSQKPVAFTLPRPVE